MQSMGGCALLLLITLKQLKAQQGMTLTSSNYLQGLFAFLAFMSLFPLLVRLVR
jgi:hypothetical protein